MNKSYLKLLFIPLLVLPITGAADGFQSKEMVTEGDPVIVAARVKGRKKSSKKRKKSRRAKRRQVYQKPVSELSVALDMAKNGKYEQASQKLFRLSLSPKYKKQRNRIKYILGMMLFQLKYNQLSAFQFISVLKIGENYFWFLK